MHLDKSFPLKYFAANLCVKRQLSEGVCVCVCTCVCMPALALGGWEWGVEKRAREKGDKEGRK